MVNLMLHREDTLDDILPAVELAMHNGDVCRIHNIAYLGTIQRVALALLAGSPQLLDTDSGCVVQRRPGFCLQGIDEGGVARNLAA